MAKRNKVTDAPSAAGDVAEEASSLLRRLIDEAQLREAVARVIDEGQLVADKVEELPAKGRKARKQAAKQLKEAKKQATKKARKAQKKAQKKAAKQEQKLAKKRKSVGKQKQGRKVPVLGLIGLGGIGALVVSEKLRSKLLDALFGAEEEFQYTPPEPPASDNPGTPLSAV